MPVINGFKRFEQRHKGTFVGRRTGAPKDGLLSGEINMNYGTAVEWIHSLSTHSNGGRRMDNDAWNSVLWHSLDPILADHFDFQATGSALSNGMLTPTQNNRVVDALLEAIVAGTITFSQGSAF